MFQPCHRPIFRSCIVNWKNFKGSNIYKFKLQNFRVLAIQLCIISLGIFLISAFFPDSNIDNTPAQLPPTAKVHPMKKSIYQTQSLAHTPSSRSNALVIVSDLLRKVSNMESKIASCRTYSSAQMHASAGNGTPIGEYVQNSNNGVNAPLRSAEHNDETMAI